MEVIKDTPQILIQRHEMPKKHRLSLLDDIYVEPGTKEDWLLLNELHYKGSNEGVGPRRWRIAMNGQTIGVCTMTVPKTLLSGRNELFDHLRPNQDGKDNRMINQHRLKWINANVYTNSRLVIDTMYRGAGIAYRAQNLIMRMTGRRFIEFQSSMSRFNPFAQKAGIVFTKPRRATNYERGLKFFRKWFECHPSDFVGVKAELDSMPEVVREKCLADMRHFYYQYSSMEKSGNNRMNGTSRVDGLTPEVLIKSTQQLAFASPMYGMYENPDVKAALLEKRELIMPERLPLLAFDNQGVNEPLNMEKLNALKC